MQHLITIGIGVCAFQIRDFAAVM